MLPAIHNRYVNFFTDFAFKRLFGSELSKPILLDFLNELLYQEQGRIVSLTYLTNEQVGRSEFDRKAIFDLYCENERGERFIVEIQRAKQKYFKDRILFYSTFPIVEQAQKSADWDFKLTPIYVVAILGFVFDDDEDEPDKYRYDVKLADVDTGKVFYDKLTFIYLAMPKFTKTEAELSNRFEKWLYVLKNLNQLDRIPASAREAVFKEFFHLAEIAQFSREERDAYDGSLNAMWIKNADWTTALEEAETKGMAQGEAIGEARGVCRTILDFLRERFSEIPDPLVEKLQNIHDVTVLRKLIPMTLKADSLEAFVSSVDKALGVTHQ